MGRAAALSHTIDVEGPASQLVETPMILPFIGKDISRSVIFCRAA